MQSKSTSNCRWAQAVQANEEAPQVRARVQVDISGIAGEGAQEETSSPNGPRASQHPPTTTHQPGLERAAPGMSA